MLTVAVCGNHRVVYCTESELAWTLTNMGHQVVKFQENVHTTDEMLAMARFREVQLFVYVHTHGWTTPGKLSLPQLFEQFRAHGIKTASFHLDRFWGLHSDQREARIGEHPFWKTDMVFTADGGHQQEFEARGVRHQWLPPAVAARHCWRGTYRRELAADIVFVGSRRYHPEYKFRTMLVDWLQDRYRKQFRRFGHDVGGVVREAQLNDVYASAKVVVGDSCFAGSPYYWSDRVPETLGRGGFLIHPTTPGLTIDGMAEFSPANLAELQQQIAYWLVHDEERRVCTDKAMAVVRAEHTYTQRMTQLLRTMGFV